MFGANLDGFMVLLLLMMEVVGVVAAFQCWSHVSDATVTVSLAPVLVGSADLETFLFPPGK